MRHPDLKFSVPMSYPPNRNRRNSHNYMLTASLKPSLEGQRRSPILSPTIHTLQRRQLPSINSGLLSQPRIGTRPYELPLPKVASQSSGVVRSYAATSYKGLKRNYNEDRVLVIINVPKAPLCSVRWPKCHFFGLFDGHGGSACCEFLRKKLQDFVCSDSSFPTDPALALTRGFLAADAEFSTFCLKHGEYSGSCALVLLLVENVCYIGNVGDSRAVLSGENGHSTIDLSRDHKPLYEEQRLIRSGARVYKPPLGPARVIPGGLAVSRSFGDVAARCPELNGNPYAIIAKPEIATIRLNTDSDFILAASDGVFDVLSSKEAALVARDALKQYAHYGLHAACGNAASAVIAAAMERRSSDNVTALVVALEGLERVNRSHK